MQLLIMKQDKPPHFKGDIVEIRASGTPFGGKEPEAFVLVEVPGVPMTDYEQYNRAWDSAIDFEVVAQDQEQDGFRLRLFATVVNGALGVVTRDQVEAFVNGWGGVVRSVGTNEVVFDIRIYDALTSMAFWEYDGLDAVVFSELSYDQATGVHRIQADWSALNKSPTAIERYVRKMGLSVVSHRDRVLVYEATRAVVRQAFEEDIAEKSRRVVAKRRYRVTAAVVDYVVGHGGTIETDLATLSGYIRDKATG